MKISLFGNNIVFSLNPPTSETDYLSETFDFNAKRAYATIGIQELLKHRNDAILQMILGAIFDTLRKTAELQKLDYLQNIRINDIDVWCIDDGEGICLMTKEEY